MAKKKPLPRPQPQPAASLRVGLSPWPRLLAPRIWLEWGFLLSLLLIPLVFHGSNNNSIVAKDFYGEWFALWFVAFGAAVSWKEKGSMPFPKGALVCLLAYLLYGTLRMLFSPYPEHSWGAWRASLVGIAPVWAAYLVGRNPRALRKTWLVLSVVVLIAGVYAAFQFVAVWMAGTGAPYDEWPRTIDPVRWPWRSVPVLGELMKALEIDLSYFRWEEFEGLRSLPGVCSTLGNPNFFAGFLVPLFPLLCALAWKAWKGESRVLPSPIPLFLPFLFLASLVMAGSRGGFLGILGAASLLPLFLGILLAQKRGPGVRKAGALVTAVIAVGMVGTLAFLFGSPSRPEIEKGIGALENRSIVFRSTVRLISDHPLFGVSPGVYAIRFPDYLFGPEAEKYGWMESPEDKVLEHAHSEPLEVLADLGLVGFLLWAGALVGWFLWCLRGFSLSLDRRTSWLIAALMAGAVGVLFQNLISVNLRWTASAWTFWTVVGLAGGLASRSLGGTRVEGRERLGTPVWLVPACAGFVLLLFLPSARRYTGDWFFSMGRSAALQKRPEAEEILLRAKNLNPSFPQTYYLLAGIYYERENYQETIAMYEKVRDLRGNVVVLVENMATAYMKMSTVLEKDHERKQAVLDAIDLYESSLDRHPSFPRLADYLSRAYQRLGFVELATDYRKKAIELYEKWLDWESSYPRPQYALDLSKNYFLDKNYERSFWMLRTAVRWGIAEESIANLRDALFQIDPEYRKLWEREDRKLAEQKTEK